MMTDTNVDDSVYVNFVAALSKALRENFESRGSALFTTDVSGDALWEAYLGSFADPAERQYHNCNTCKAFIRKYGGIAVIDTVYAGHYSAFWDDELAPEGYKEALRAMARLVARAKVSGVFLSSDAVWGRFEDGGWNHFALRPTAAMLYRIGVKTAFEAMAEKLEDFKNVQRALGEYGPETINKALALLNADQLYRAEKFTGPVEWLKRLHSFRNRGPLSNNLFWHAIAKAPAGYCHPRSSVIGTLLDDIKAGVDLVEVKRRFAEKTRPSVYQRATVAPTAGAVESAEKLFAKLELAPALPRRFASFNEVPLLWKPYEPQRPTAPEGALFGHVKLKGADPQPADLTGLQPTVMTMEKFSSKILPNAQEIELLVPATAERCMAIVAPVNADAPQLFQWSNLYSWYYADGVDAEIRRRVLEAGGQYQDVDVRVSLIWNNRNDLDVHMLTPNGSHLYYASKRAQGGYLDVDRNVGGETETPVENIRWLRGQAPGGEYRIWVELYRSHTRAESTPFKVEIEVLGRVLTYEGVMDNKQHVRHNVAWIHITNGVGRVVPISAGKVLRAADTAATDWNLRPGTFTRVKGITSSPNFWGDQHVPHAGHHVFFLLDGCRDLKPARGRGFFTEMLRSDLRPVRSVLEAYVATAEIAGIGDEPACGIGVSAAQKEIDLVCRVRTDGVTALYKIDRWD